MTHKNPKNDKSEEGKIKVISSKKKKKTNKFLITIKQNITLKKCWKRLNQNKPEL